MKRKKNAETKRPSWRDIQQGGGSRKATSKPARKRRLLILLRTSLGLLLLVAIASGILGLLYFQKTATDRNPLAESTHFETQLEFQTNGVLTASWVKDKLGELMRSDLRGIDVQAVKKLLEDEGQIATASVSVVLPKTLQIKLEEREPILRVRLRSSSGKGETLLIAREGTLYHGLGYPRDTLRQLPGTGGLRIRKDNSGYYRLEGLEEVARLLDLAKERMPSVYRHWQIVDLSDWDPEVDYRPSLVRIRSAHIKELIFATTRIEEQLERLAGILEHLDRYQMGLPVFIDLSYQDEAVIRYK